MLVLIIKMEIIMDIKMFVTDLDGTLLNENSLVSLANRQALKKMKEQGILIVIATGRVYAQVERLLKEWQIEDYVDYILAVNGNQIYDRQSKSLKLYNPLSPKHIQSIYKNKKIPGFRIFIHKDTIYSRFFNPIAALMAYKDKLNYKILSKRNIKKMEFDRMMFFSWPDLTKKAFAEGIEGCRLIPVRKLMFEVYNPVSSKMNGIEKLLQKHHIKKEEVISFGDDYNDLEMLSETLGIAMENGKKAAIKAAKDTTISNKEDGVAWYLKKIGLI